MRQTSICSDKLVHMWFFAFSESSLKWLALTGVLFTQWKLNDHIKKACLSSVCLVLSIWLCKNCWTLRMKQPQCCSSHKWKVDFFGLLLMFMNIIFNMRSCFYIEAQWLSSASHPQFNILYPFNNKWQMQGGRSSAHRLCMCVQLLFWFMCVRQQKLGG